MDSNTTPCGLWRCWGLIQNSNNKKEAAKGVGQGCVPSQHVWAERLPTRCHRQVVAPAAEIKAPERTSEVGVVGGWMQDWMRGVEGSEDQQACDTSTGHLPHVSVSMTFLGKYSLTYFFHSSLHKHKYVEYLKETWSICSLQSISRIFSLMYIINKL